MDSSFVGYTKNGEPIVRVGTTIFKEAYDNTLRPVEEEELWEEFAEGMDEDTENDFPRLYDPDEGQLEAY